MTFKLNIIFYILISTSLILGCKEGNISKECPEFSSNAFSLTDILKLKKKVELRPDIDAFSKCVLFSYLDRILLKNEKFRDVNHFNLLYENFGILFQKVDYNSQTYSLITVKDLSSGEVYIFSTEFLTYKNLFGHMEINITDESNILEFNQLNSTRCYTSDSRSLNLFQILFQYDNDGILDPYFRQLTFEENLEKFVNENFVQPQKFNNNIFTYFSMVSPRAKSVAEINFDKKGVVKLILYQSLAKIDYLGNDAIPWFNDKCK